MRGQCWEHCLERLCLVRSALMKGCDGKCSLQDSFDASLSPTVVNLRSTGQATPFAASLEFRLQSLHV